MKKTYLTLIFPLAFLGCGGIATAQPVSNAVAPTVAAAPALTPDEKDRAGYEKHASAVLDALKLDDAARAAKVHDILVAQFAAGKAWHAQNDARLKELWGQYGKARSTRDPTIIDNAVSKIDAVYASFKPQHDAFKTRLAAILPPEQIETVEDAITINKVKITFNAYGEIFHGLTDAQKAFILKKLKAAREEAIDAGAMTEKSAFFKKYKDQIEAYLTAQGYDVKQCYKDFGAKQKAEMAAKKAAPQSGARPADGDKEQE